MRYKPHSSSRLPILSSRVSTNHFQFHWNINVRCIRFSARIPPESPMCAFIVFSILFSTSRWERAFADGYFWREYTVPFIGGFTVCFEPLPPPPLSTWVQTIWIECGDGDEEEVEERNKIETPIHSSILPHARDGQVTIFAVDTLRFYVCMFVVRFFLLLQSCCRRCSLAASGN